MAHAVDGQVLVELDCSPLSKEVDVRAANLAAAEAVYQRLVNGPRPEEIAIGEAGVGVAQARAEEARATLDRPTGSWSASPSRLRSSSSMSAIPASPTPCSWTRRKARAAKGQLALRGHRRGQGSARRRLSLPEGKAELDQCSVRAPAAGTVKVFVTLAQFVSTYAPTTLVQLTPDAK
jgi:multidrug efflux pump subunit AcrA (membrane-fusion protein)